MSTQEQLFISKALASVEKAEKLQRIRLIVVTAMAFAGAFWFAFRAPAAEVNLECTLFVGIGLMVAICTAKIMTLINRNTRTILQAIHDLQQK